MLNKFIKSGLDLSVFTALSLFSNPALSQFLTAIAGAVGVAFANYILFPLIRKMFKFIRTKIKGNDYIPNDIEEKMLEGLDDLEERLDKEIKELIENAKEDKGD